MHEPSTGNAPRYKLTLHLAQPRILAALLMMLAVLLAPVSAGAQASLPSIVVERQSGTVLMENRPFDRWYPASLTKLMTIYVTLRALAAGEISPGSPVTISAKSSKEPPSKMGYGPGTQLRFDTALKILIVKSANDVAMAIAESVAGTEAAFVDRMNAEAARLGMADSRFANPNGLHDTAQYTTVRDMALLATHILDEFPQYVPYFAIPAIKAGDKVEHSFNLLLERFTGADGMKTGFVCASGYNMVASATRNGRQLIAVVFGTDSQTARAVEAARLLLQGFERSGGPSIETFVSAKPPVPPRSQRATMCSEAALKARYDLMPGDMVINSALLSPRVPGAPVTVTTGGIDGPPSSSAVAAQGPAGRKGPKGAIPVPTKRPAYTPAQAAGQ
jgi:D-alanyl-D-alanine carboxypeptidase